MRNASGISGPSGEQSLVPRGSHVSVAALPVPAIGYQSDSGDGGDWIAYEFGRMRADLRLTVPALARRIGIDVATINNFESGAVDGLPPWHETVRIVEAYAAMLGTDPSRILSRLLVHQPITSVRTDPTHPVGALPLPLPLPVSAQRSTNVAVSDRAAQRTSQATETKSNAAAEKRKRSMRRLRRTLTLGGTAAAVVVLGLSIQSSPRALYALADVMPSAMQLPLRAGAEYLVLNSAPSHDGLKWIDVGDPRTRKGDKLRVAKR